MTHETYAVVARPRHRPRVLEFEYGATDPDTGAYISDFRTLTRDEAAHELRRLRRHHYVERRHCRYFIEESLT